MKDYLRYVIKQKATPFYDMLFSYRVLRPALIVALENGSKLPKMHYLMVNGVKTRTAVFMPDIDTF